MKIVRMWLTTLALSLATASVHAQELQAKVTINRSQIQGTDASVFESLQQTLEQFINDRQWTNLQFQKNERIVCNFNLTCRGKLADKRCAVFKNCLFVGCNVNLGFS